jgi:PAS domain S-box-containing protein
LNTRHPFSIRPLAVVFWAVALGGLYLTRLYSFLLFHGLAELFSISIACGVFMVVWNARRSLENSYLLYVATAYVYAAALDALHLLSYKGMGVFPGFDANAPTQLWIAARYFQSLALLAAPWLADRRVNPSRALAGYGMFAALLAASVFAGVFPDCFVEGKGLTPFKIYSEYAIALIFTGSIVLLRVGRSHLDEDVRSRLVASIGAMVLAEISFTLYGRDVYGFFNLLGHFLKIVSFYLLYRAVIATDLIQKLERLVRDLGRREEEARDSRDRLEERVAARTAELHDAIARLAAELAVRQRAQEAARHLASFPEMNPSPVLEVNLSGAVIYSNPTARRLAEDRGKGNDFSSLLPEDLGAILKEREKAAESTFAREVRVGGRVFAETIHFPPRLGVARIYFSDITERTRAEEELRAAKDGLEARVEERTSELRRTTEELRAGEERFRALVERLPVGICIVQDGRILFRNPRLEMLFGPVREGLEFRRWMDIHPEDAAPFGDLCEALDSGVLGPTGTDLRFYPSGKAAEGVGARWVHLRATPIDHQGRPAALLSLIDVTRAKELEHIVRVREKMSALGHIATGIAHEIRNPLSGINIYLSNLEFLFDQSAGVAPEEREKITRIVGKLKSASEKIASVIHKVMEFSKPVPPRMDRVNLNAAVEEAVRLSMVEMRRHDVHLEKCLAPDLPPCPADLRLVEQVVLNLINNASQAMEGIEGPRRIEVASFLDRARVVVRISDSGPGIPTELRSKIFDPFFTTRKEGYGIGLSFSHRIVADHGGLLSVGRSRWGGAEFRMEIPCEVEEDGPMTAATGRLATSLDNPGAGPPTVTK